MYDLEVDTSLLSPGQCADTLAEQLRQGPYRTAFRKCPTHPAPPLRRFDRHAAAGEFVQIGEFTSRKGPAIAWWSSQRPRCPTRNGSANIRTPSRSRPSGMRPHSHPRHSASQARRIRP
ncbi:hypothetical protein [Mesorhizobium ciceri]|uniref:hypothetical protein n=1 Tax=Mesorhizobium ciceri TaxID=39645 RepID=UPI003F4E9068